ncbi:MAG: hypothetical protein ACX94D_00070 [Henriciella sp.]
MVRSPLFTGLIALTLGACQHSATTAPATLADETPATIEALKSALGSAINRANIDLGAGDLSGASSVTVLPPRLTEHEMRSPATPIVFNLFVRSGDCYAVQDGSEAEIPLPDVPCKPA